MSRVTRATFLEQVAPARAEDVRRMTEFGPRRAGGRLDQRAPAVPETLSVKEVLERLRAQPAGVMHYVYARLLGRSSRWRWLRRPLLAPSS